MSGEGAAAPRRSGTPGFAAAVLLISALALGATLRVAAWIGGGTWLDEYHTLLIAGAPTLRDVLALSSVEAHPPAYWVALHFVLRLLGDDPLVAKGLSVAFGLGALGLVALAARRRYGTAAAAVAATVLGGSAVAVHYATEARPYAAVAFTLVLGVLATVAAVERPSAATLLAQAAALVVALGLNFFALTLLPIGPALALRRRSGPLVARQLLVGAAAFLLTAPPLVRVATQLPPEANEYLRTFWSGRTALDALVVTGRDLLPSGRWPAAYGAEARRTPLDSGLEAAAVAGLLLALVGAAVSRGGRRGGEDPDLLALACAALLGSAAALAAGSFLLGRPVVTPGRFAASFAPSAALLAAAAAARGGATRAGAYLLAAVAAVNGGTALASREAGIRVDQGGVVAAVLKSEEQGPLLVVSVGLSGTPLKYELRGRSGVGFASFPPDVDRHFGWWAPAKALSDPAALAREAEELAGRAVAAARGGRTVVLTGADHPVAAPLRSALARSFDARPLHPLARGAFVLFLREPARADPLAPQRR